MRPARPRSLAVLGLLFALRLALPAAGAAEGPARVVAVGDVHGAFEELVAILRAAGLVDEHRRWSGGRAVLVQTGDVLDRGPRSRQALDLLMALEEDAGAAGGRAVALLGNHEVMNLMGDLRYVSAEEYASYADERSEERRAAAWRAYQALYARRGAPPPLGETAWREAHPPGFLEHREAFSAEGRYGRWLRERPAVVELDGTLFLHGGLGPTTSGLGPDEVNRRVREELAAFDAGRRYLVERDLALPFFTLEELVAAARAERDAVRAEVERRRAEAEQEGRAYAPPADLDKHLRLLDGFLGLGGWLSVASDGPLWFRGYAEWEEADAAQVEAVLGARGARRLVVAHTPQADGRIRARFGGRVVLIDTGMLAAVYGGRPSALEIEGDRVTAIYLDGREVLARAPCPEPAVWLDADKKPLPFQGDAQLEEFLRTARVVESKPVGSGITRPEKLLLEKDGVRAHAIFRYVDMEQQEVRLKEYSERFFRDSYLFECAAHALGRLFGLDGVPPVVRRTVRRRPGAVQIWVEQAFTETQRLTEQRPAPDPTCFDEQMQVLRVWDTLVDNIDRNAGNILIDGRWKVWMIDHTRAFRRDRELRRPELIRRLPRRLWERLRSVPDEEVRERLRPYLRGNEIEALLARREKLVAHVEQMIAERGEEVVLY